MQTIQEKNISSFSGYLALFAILFSGLGVLACVFVAVDFGSGLLLLIPCLIATFIFSWMGIYSLQPNQAAVMTLFGAYRGTVLDNGLRWSNPFLMARKVSLRANNLNMEKLKVNDKRGNPIEIAAAVVWKIEDAARATFEVEDYHAFMRVQAEAALRYIAAEFNYDHNDSDESTEITLMNGGDFFLGKLVEALQVRTAAAGIRVQEARLTHLAYAPEIASAMLRRRQAEAVISARKKIVLGAVSMVELALQALSEKNMVQLDDERKAAMVSNLLVVLCAEREVDPVINAGTLYH